MNPVMLTLFLTVTPVISASAHAQPTSLREAGEAAAAAAAGAGTAGGTVAQSKACVAKAQEWLKECEAEERDENADGVPDRTGLGWTGIGLASAGVVHVALGIDASRWRN